MDTLPNIEDIGNYNDAASLIKFNATVTGVENILRQVNQSVSEVLKLGYKSPTVLSKRLGVSNYVSASVWATDTQVEATEMKLTIDQHKKVVETATTTASNEIIKEQGLQNHPHAQGCVEARNWSN